MSLKTTDAQPGVFTIDPAAGQLRGPAGSVRLDPKVTDVLLALAQQDGELVGRDQLLATVWPDTVVSDHALSRCIYALRQAFVDASGQASGRAAVETLPKRGYRLTVPVMLRDPAAPVVEEPPRHDTPAALPEPPSRASLIRLALIIVAVLAVAWLMLRSDDKPQTAAPAGTELATIAVLPFADLSETQDQRFFGDGMAEEILHLLAQAPDLRVIARTSSFQFRGDVAGIRSIGERLGADYILEGSVRREAARVRITAQLIDAGDGIHLWSRAYDRDVRTVLAVQSEIASEVAATLSASLSPALLLTRDGEIDPEAAEQAYMGRFYLNRRNDGDLERATSHFRQAVNVDPGLPTAWSGLASALYLRAVEGRMPRDEGLAEAAEASARAIELAPNRAEGLFRAALIAYRLGDFEASKSFRARATTAEPRHPLVMWFRANTLARESAFQDAVAIIAEIAQLDPLNAATRNNLGVIQAAGGDFEGALATLMELRTLNPALPDIDARIAGLQLLTGDAEAAASKALAAPPGPFRDRALALIGRGGGPDGNEAARLRLEGDGTGLAAVLLAEIAAYGGNEDTAFAWLELAIKRLAQVSDADAYRVLTQVVYSPFLIGIRDDDRWWNWWQRVPGCHYYPIAPAESAEAASRRHFRCIQSSGHADAPGAD